MSRRLGFIGCGQMARALASGFLGAGRAAPEDVAASDVLADARLAFERQTGCQTCESNQLVASECDVLILAVKPQVLGAVLLDLRPVVTADHLVISIAAAIPLARLAEGLGHERRLVRVMPNTPCLVGASATAIAAGGSASPADELFVEQLFQSVGVAIRVPEALLDAVTGLSGSGPAYVYQIIEALSDGGVRAGLPRDVATRLAAQTVLGAAKMVLDTGKHPGELKDMVTSPGGTAIAGLAVLEQHGVRGALIEAVTAATERARQLAR